MKLNLKHFFIISLQIICERVSQGQLHPQVLFLCSVHGTDITKGSCLHGTSPATSTRAGSFYKFQHTGHSKKTNCNTCLCTSTGILALLLRVDCSSLLITTQMLVYRASRVMMYKTLSFTRKTPAAQFTNIYYRHIEMIQDVYTALELWHTNTS